MDEYMENKFQILFCCMGNICRSPTAEGVFQSIMESHQLSDRIDLDSAGTHAYHVGNAPDPRSQAAALKRGMDLSSLRARQINQQDFEKFDLILAMDKANYENMLEKCPIELQHKIEMMLEYGSADTMEVPDPYYGGANGFEKVLDLLQDASDDLCQQLSRRLK